MNLQGVLGASESEGQSLFNCSSQDSLPRPLPSTGVGICWPCANLSLVPGPPWVLEERDKLFLGPQTWCSSLSQCWDAPLTSPPHLGLCRIFIFLSHSICSMSQDQANQDLLAPELCPEVSQEVSIQSQHSPSLATAVHGLIVSGFPRGELLSQYGRLSSCLETTLAQSGGDCISAGPHHSISLKVVIIVGLGVKSHGSSSWLSLWLYSDVWEVPSVLSEPMKICIIVLVECVKGFFWQLLVVAMGSHWVQGSLHLPY